MRQKTFIMIAIAVCKQLLEGERSQVSPNRAHPKLYVRDQASDPSQIPSNCECKCKKKRKSARCPTIGNAPASKTPEPKLTDDPSQVQKSKPKSDERTEKGRCVCDLARVGTDNDVVATSVELLAATNAVLTLHALSAVLLDVRGVGSHIRRADGELVDLRKSTC